jgi:hypothetical protein
MCKVQSEVCYQVDELNLPPPRQKTTPVTLYLLYITFVYT